MIDTIRSHRKKGLITLGILFLLVSVFFTAIKLVPLPTLNAFLHRQGSVQFYDTTGKLLHVTPLENGVRREFTALGDIPKELIHAFIEAEDSRFYIHSGVDYSAVLRAIGQNASEKRRVSGASTITMQLARMIYPSQKRGWAAKIKESINAHLIETRLTKNQILELYLNSLPFGYNVEGVTSAARFFFSENLDQLSPGQISCLSVIPRRPALYNPLVNPQICAEAAFLLYIKTYGSHLENKKACDKEIQDYLVSSAHSAKRYEWPFAMPHYIQQVKSTIDPSKTVVVLSAQSDLQQFAEFHLQDALNKAASSRIRNGAVLVIENKTGHVLAWVGSNDWFDENHSGQIDGVLVPNQPGSSMKPFLYALALEQKNNNGEPLFLPAQILPDIPMEFGSEALYIPLNFNNRFNGPVLFRTSLASSLNVPAVYMLSKIGVENYIEFLVDTGFNSLKHSGAKADLGLALGAGEVTLAELVTAFSVFPRDGIFLPLGFEKKASAQETGKRVLLTDTARIMCNILSDKSARVKGFGYSQVFETNYPSIFKTGTANQYQNIVALGSTAEYTVGVWMGNFSGNTVVGKTGSSLPALIAKKILDFLNTDAQIPFQEPEHWKKIPICPVSGMRAGENCPSAMHEYVPSTASFSAIEECTWHKSIGHNEVITVYPAEYQQWFTQGFRKGMLDHAGSTLTIITPVEGSVFYFDPTEKKRQKILVEVIGGSEAYEENLRVLYDGSPLIENGNHIIVIRPFSFFLPVERGKHTLEVVFGNEKHKISFTVK